MTLNLRIPTLARTWTNVNILGSSSKGFIFFMST
jgi:hypothetical protein